jgi:hypothetical protein
MDREDADLRAAFDRGRNAWPGLNLDQELYALRVASTGIADVDLAMRAEDIYLAVACACGNPGARRGKRQRHARFLPPLLG